MSNASLQLGGGNFAVKDGKLLGYATDPKTSVFVSREFDFSRGSNLAATRVDANGLIEKGRENLLLQSNQFDTTWTDSGANVSVTSGQSGYDNSTDAWLLDLDYTGGDAYLRQEKSISGVNTFSIYAKSGSVDGIYIEFAAGSFPNIKVDLSDGSLISTNGTIDTNIESVGNGWYRVSLSVNQSLVRVNIRSVNGSGTNTTGTIYIQDAQLEYGLVATDYIETGATTAQAGILEDMPRIDYSGGASCPSLLLEPTRTNLVPHSEYFGGGTLSNATLSLSGTSPENATNTYALTETTANAEHYWIAEAMTTATNNNLVSTIFVKPNGRTKIRLWNYYLFNQYARVDIDLTNNTTSNGVGSNVTFVSADITDYANGWKRVEIQSLKTASTYAYSIRVNLLDDSGNDVYAGDVTKGVYIYGAQMEQNASYPTSYIPTYGSSVTRSADNPADKTLNYGSQFSLFFDMNGLGGSASNNFIVRFGTSNPIYLSVRKSDKKLQFYSPASPTGYFATTATKKIAISCDGTNWIWSSDGASGSLTATGSNNAEYVRISTDGSAGGGFASALVNQIVFFDTALTAGELNALTTL